MNKTQSIQRDIKEEPKKNRTFVFWALEREKANAKE